MPKPTPDHYPPKENIAQGTDLASIFEDVSQRENLSEIKRPLVAQTNDIASFSGNRTRRSVIVAINCHNESDSWHNEQ